ncbi:hypothetical protein N2152v2_003402 [Parachlorella kessleri]
MQELVAALLAALLPLLEEQPFALFGHSMGAWVAFALAQELQRRGGPLPLKLYASANRSPLLAGVANDVDPAEMHRLPKAQFWEHMEARYGRKPELEDRHMRDFAERTLRADFQLIETFQPAVPRLRLPCPVLALGGRSDKRLTHQQLEAWGEVAPEGAFQWRLLDGGHDYVATHREELLSVLSHDLSSMLHLAPAATCEMGATALAEQQAAGPHLAEPRLQQQPAGAAAASPRGQSQAQASSLLQSSQSEQAGEAVSVAAAAVREVNDSEELPVSTSASLKYRAAMSSSQQPPQSQLEICTLTVVVPSDKPAPAAVIAAEEEGSSTASLDASAAAGSAAQQAQRGQLAPTVASMVRDLPKGGPADQHTGAGPAFEADTDRAPTADPVMCAGLRRQVRACLWWW